MNIVKMNFGIRTTLGALSLIASVLLVGCSSSGSEEKEEPVVTATVNATFDGTWRSDCFKQFVDNIPEEDQPDGYIQRTLTIDSATNAYSTTPNVYTDSQCMLEDPEHKIKFDGIVTTSSGMDATVARYYSDKDSPDLVGLLYRDGDILYREAGQSGVIDDSIPTALDLSNPWRLVN